MVSITELVNYADDLLAVHQYKDYCPNGLQVEGKKSVQTIISGVTASQALLDAAVKAGADALIVHHGYFWKGEDPRVIGMKKNRLHTLLSSGTSLLAYHLPLDDHPELGNNVQLAKRLNLTPKGKFGRAPGDEIGVYGSIFQAMTAEQFAKHLHNVLGREPLHIAGHSAHIETVAWCTGAAQSYIEQAVMTGVDAFISGEISEQTVHIARETGIHFFSAGHHATERYGVQALGDHLAQHFNIKHRFIDIDNPV